MVATALLCSTSVGCGPPRQDQPKQQLLRADLHGSNVLLVNMLFNLAVLLHERGRNSSCSELFRRRTIGAND
jgi:hypothetical protein